MINLGFDFERRLEGMLRNSLAAQSIKPINLGGVTGSGGGVGSPIGGFVGQLAQSFVTYDTSELAEDTPVPLPSAVSLVTNLNKIRYDISQLDSRITVIEDEEPVDTFLELLDTPSTYSGNVGKYVRVSSGNVLEFVDIPSGEFITLFTELTDTPSSYSGQSGRIVIVNEGETGLEFVQLATQSANDPFALHTNISGEINGLTEKSSIVSDDVVVIEDSEDSYNKKKFKLSAFIPSGDTYWQSSGNDIENTNNGGINLNIPSGELATINNYPIGYVVYATTEPSPAFLGMIWVQTENNLLQDESESLLVDDNNEVLSE